MPSSPHIHDGRFHRGRVLLTVLVLGGCTGSIGDALQAGKATEQSVCAAQPSRGLTFDRLRRFSSAEVANTLAALFGPAIYADAQIQAQLQGMPADTLVLAGDFHDDPPATLALTMDTIAKRAAVLAVNDAAWRARYLGACATSETIDDTCVRGAVAKLAPRILRRDVSSAEVDAYMAFYQTVNTDSAGFTYLLRRMFQSPQLTFHVEDGVASEDGSVRLSDFEIASRISYFVGNTMPDDTLMDAARNGELQTVDGVNAQVTRLLDTSEARAKVRDFFRYYAHLGDIPDPLPNEAARIGITSTAGLGLQMREEAFEFFESVFWHGGTFAELMSSTTAYPHSAELAAVFGTASAPAGEGAVTAAHVGLLHRPALLTSPTPRTSPILRGAHLRKLFLCDDLGTPPVDAVKARQAEVGDVQNMSNRERVANLTDSPACLGCHTNINKTGFAFEGFDPVGAKRSEEVVLDTSGAVSATWPLDTSVADLVLDGKTASYASSADLAVAIADSEIGRACITRRMFEYYRLSVIAKADACTVATAQVVSGQGSVASTLVALLANDDIFWRKEP